MRVAFRCLADQVIQISVWVGALPRVHNLCGDRVHVVPLWRENSSWRPGLAA
jgi:hypothetical protein